MESREPYIPLSQTVTEYETSETTLRRLVNTGRLTRHKALRDTRRTLYSRAQLDAIFGPRGMSTPAEAVTVLLDPAA